MARSLIALVACMVLIVPPPSLAQVRTPTGTPPGSEETHAPARFDIDEQALATALRGFSEQSGIAVLFDDNLVADRRSAGLHGMASPHDALRILLVGTGLSAHFSSMNAFTVTLNAADPANEPAPSSTGVADATPVLDERSAGAVQIAIEHALCARSMTRPGTFRLAMQLRIDSSGVVVGATALAPSNDAARDEKVLASLRGVRLPSRTSGFSPVTVLLMPASPGVDPCRHARAGEG